MEHSSSKWIYDVFYVYITRASKLKVDMTVSDAQPVKTVRRRSLEPASQKQCFYACTGIHR